jgi:hypothetical protein
MHAGVVVEDVYSCLMSFLFNYFINVSTGQIRNSVTTDLGMHSVDA